MSLRRSNSRGLLTDHNWLPCDGFRTTESRCMSCGSSTGTIWSVAITRRLVRTMLWTPPALRL